MLTILDAGIIILTFIASICAGLILADSLRRYREDRASRKFGTAVAEKGETEKGKCTICGEWDDSGRSLYFDGKRVGYSCYRCEHAAR